MEEGFWRWFDIRGLTAAVRILLISSQKCEECPHPLVGCSGCHFKVVWRCTKD